jgi:gas vesicle protein
LSTLNQGSFNALRNIVFNFGDLLNNQIQNVFANQLQKTLDDFVKGISISVKDAVRGIVGIAGNALKGLTSPTSGIGQGLGGALTGAAAGSAFGLVGGVIGGVVGLLGGILGAGKAKKQQELQEKQLAEAEKQTKLLEQSNALAYTSSIIGRMTNQGTVTGFEINSMGNLVAKLQGKDLLIMLDRATEAKKRGR